MTGRRRNKVLVRVCDYRNCKRDAAIRVEWLGDIHLQANGWHPGSWGDSWDFCSFEHAQKFQEQTIARDPNFRLALAR